MRSQFLHPDGILPRAHHIHKNARQTGTLSILSPEGNVSNCPQHIHLFRAEKCTQKHVRLQTAYLTDLQHLYLTDLQHLYCHCCAFSVDVLFARSREEGEKPQWLPIWHFYCSFFKWRCGTHGSERVKRWLQPSKALRWQFSPSVTPTQSPNPTGSELVQKSSLLSLSAFLSQHCCDLETRTKSTELFTKA